MYFHIYLFFASILALILEGISTYFLLKRQINKELNKLKVIADNLHEQGKFFEKNKILESRKDIVVDPTNIHSSVETIKESQQVSFVPHLPLVNLNSFDEIRKEQKKLDAEFRKRLKRNNDSTK